MLIYKQTFLAGFKKCKLKIQIHRSEMEQLNIKRITQKCLCLVKK